MASKRLVTVLVLATLAAIVLGYTYINVLELFKVEMKVNVPGPSEPVRVILDVNTSRGSRTYENIARIVVSEDTGIVFKLLSSEAKGNFSIAVSGQVVLKGEDRSYTIDMPCLYVKDTACYRIQMIIPGYDQPLHLPKGEYNVTLTLNWADAKGEGTLVLEIAAVQEASTTPS